MHIEYTANYISEWLTDGGRQVLNGLIEEISRLHEILRLHKSLKDIEKTSKRRNEKK